MSSLVSSPQKRRSILVGVCLALMAVIASVTGLNVAQPQVAVSLGASQSEVLWVINIYAITLAALLLPLGALGDRWGRKPVMIGGILIFAAANLLSALTPSTEMLLVARFLSGVGAALIMPVTLATITSTFPEEDRAQGVGIWTAVAGGGGILGMFLSAVLVDFLNWRWLFVLPIVLSGVALVVSMKAVPNSRETNVGRFDLVGAVVSVVMIMGVIVALHEGPGQGWASPVVLVSAIVGALATMVFVVCERRQTQPLVDLRDFRKRALSNGSLVILVWFGVQAGVFIVLFPFFQTVLGWSGLQATLGMMPMAILMMVASTLAPKLVAHLGSKLTIALGIALGALGLFLTAALVSIDQGFLSILPGMVAMGLGMGLSLTPSTEAITSSLPDSRQGVASALNDVTRELGTALGVALLGAVFASGYAQAVSTHLVGEAQAVMDAGRLGIANLLELLQSGGVSQTTILAAREAFLQGWRQAMGLGAGILVVLMVMTLFLAPKKTPSLDR